MSFAGKKIVITGAAMGIGAEIATDLVGRGAEVALGDFAPLDQTVARIAEAGGKCHALTLDVTDENAVKAFASNAAAALGSVDGLVNNAGSNGECQLVEDMPLASWNKTISTNLTGTMLVTREFTPALKQAGGNIVNVASNVARRGLPYRADYVCSKWALLGLTQTLALELAESGVRVNAICPGPVEGERIEQLVANHAKAEGRSFEETRADWVSGSPMKRFIATGEVASVVAFLLDEAASSAMTGQALNITAGMIMT